MANDSLQQSFLTPTNTVLEDDDLLDFLQPIIVGISGFTDPTLVRPRYQLDDTPNMPPVDADWISFGIPREHDDTFNYQTEDPSGNFAILEYTEQIDLMLSIYGEHAKANSKILRAGFSLAQNRFYLQQQKIDLMSVGDPVTLPSLLTGKWQRRVDITFTLRRYVSRTYGIKSVVSLPPPGPAGAGLYNEFYITPLNIEEPT